MINLTLRSSQLKMLLVTAVLFLTGFSSKLMSKTDVEGEMTFTVRTTTANGNFSPRHVLAIWIEDANGFVITRIRRADKRKQYLYTWNTKSGGNVTDATTGATLSSHQTHSVAWNCKDSDGNLVPDGEYHVYVEFTEEHAQGPMRKVSFTKGSEPVSLTPADDDNFKDLALQFEPAITITAGFTFSADELAISFTNTSTGASSYEWNFGDSNTSEEESPSHTYADAGTYSVTLKSVSGSNSDTDVQEVTVTSTVGIGGSEGNAPLIYPNPTNGMLIIALDKDAGISRIKIITTNGGLVYSVETEGKSSQQVNMDAYESGTYILQVANQKRAYRQKIIRE